MRSLMIIVGTSLATGLLALGWAMAQIDEESSEALVWRHTDLHARYAEARLRLAEACLRKAEALNAAKPRQVTEADLRSLRIGVELRRADVEETLRRPHGNGFESQRKAAQAAVRLAEQELLAAKAVNLRHDGTISPLDMQVLELRLNTTRIRAAVWDDPVFRSSYSDVLQMQIDQLVDQLHDVLHDVENSHSIYRYRN